MATREGVIIEWRSRSPFGYALSDGERVFLHISNFAARSKWPEERDRVKFVDGTDPQGRPCAQQIVLIGRGGVLGWRHFGLLALLLVLPAAATPVLLEWFSWWWIAVYVLTTSALTCLNLWIDKRFAVAARSRVPETTLHLFELTGGWPASFLAQRFFRHKISKTSYQVLFWLIVLMHQLFALDLICGGFLHKGLQQLGGNGG